MGTTTNAIPVRLERGEPADVLIMVGYALDDLVKNGKAIADSKVDLVRSPIAVAVKSGTPKPDISTPDALKRALLAVKTVAYSDSASGVYVSTEMFGKLGIADEMKDKARKIPATPVGEIVARGDAEIGFRADERIEAGRRHRHRRPAAGELQKITIFSAGIATVSKEPDAGKALIKFSPRPRRAPKSSRAAWTRFGWGYEQSGATNTQVVVARLDRAIQYAAAAHCETNSLHGVLDAPPSGA